MYSTSCNSIDHGNNNNNDIRNDIIRGAVRKVQSDFEALTQRATARHIVVRNEKGAIALKRKIRNECLERESYVVDVFEKAANKYSKDILTNCKGGLLGELAPLGHSRRVSNELDRLCFSVPLGQGTCVFIFVFYGYILFAVITALTQIICTALQLTNMYLYICV